PRPPKSRVYGHRTLHAAVAWSHSMLSGDERALFESLAVFANGTLLDGAAAVAGLDEYDALDLLARLVNRSLVVAIPTESGTRYRLLETLRQFGEDELDAAGRLGVTRDRQLSWM